MEIVKKNALIHTEEIPRYAHIERDHLYRASFESPDERVIYKSERYKYPWHIATITWTNGRRTPVHLRLAYLIGTRGASSAKKVDAVQVRAMARRWLGWSTSAALYVYTFSSIPIDRRQDRR